MQSICTKIALSTLTFFVILSTQAATITSVQSGNWSNNNTWDCNCMPVAGDNVVIGTHIVTVNQNYSITDIEITVGGIITSGGKTLTITGNLTIDGAISGGVNVNLSGTNIISGSGVMSTNGNIDMTGGNKTITAGASIDLSAASLSTINIDAGVTVTNDRFWISGAKIKGNAASSTWIQGAGSSLRVGDDFIVTGTLSASGIGNTIEYYQDGDQTIKTSSDSYYNLTLSGSGNKDLTADIDIDGNLNVTSGNFDPGDPVTFTINIAGDWTNTGGFTEGTGLVVFDGTTDQTLSVAGGETFNDLTINKTGDLILNNNVDVLNTLDLTAVLFADGVNGGGNLLTVGSSVTSIGTVTVSNSFFYNGQFKKWVNQTGLGTTYYKIPLGDNSGLLSTVFEIKFDNLTNGAVTVEFINDAPGIAGFTLDDSGTTIYNTFSEGYWDVSSSDGLTTTQFDLRLKASNFTSFTLAPDTRVVSRANPAANWSLDGIHQIAGSVKARRQDLTTLNGNFAVADKTNCTAPTTPVISGNSTVCTNDNGGAYSVTDNGDTYTWSVVGGTIASGQGTSSITVDWGSTGMEGSVEVVATNVCTSTFPVTNAVDIGPLPTSSITGNTALAKFTSDEPYAVVNEAGYTYTWTITGGALDTGQGTNSITVDWGVEGAGNVSVVGSNGCGSAVAEDTDINIYDAIESVQSGIFINNNTWICSCTPAESIRIMPAHTVRLNGDETIADLIIEPAGQLNLNGNNLTVTNDANIDGFVTGSGDLILSGNTTIIDGVGSIDNTGDISITGGAKTILSSSALSKSDGNLSIASDITVTNNGVFTLNGSLTGGNANSRFINASSSTLSVTGTLLSTGTLISSANANTVNYTGLVDQTVFPTTYHNLGASGDGIKSLGVNTAINGTMQISDDASLDVTASDFTITVSEDWINTSIDADPFVERTSSVTFDGSTLQTLIATSGETFYDFTINNAAGATLDDPLTISNSLTLSNGIINTSAGNELILADNATTSAAENFSHVDGPMDKIGDDAFIFPVGDGGNYQAIEISAPGATSDRFQAQYFQSGHPDQSNMDITLDHVSAMEYWDLSLIAGTPTVNVTLHWDSYSLVSSDAGERNDLRAAHYLTGNWTDEGNDGITGDETAGTIVVNGINTFSPWTLASISNANPLPITLVDFNAYQKDLFVEIKWTTASEINNDFFTIERSNDGLYFHELMTLEGAGNTNLTMNYSAVDNNPFYGFSYYRLKQTDYDGQYSYSNIIVVRLDHGLQALDFTLFPNPTKDKLNIKVTGNTVLDLYIEIYNAQGQKLENVSSSMNIDGFELDVEHLNTGLYLVHLINEDYRGVRKFVKK